MTFSGSHIGYRPLSTRSTGAASISNHSLPSVVGSSIGLPADTVVFKTNRASLHIHHTKTIKNVAKLKLSDRDQGFNGSQTHPPPCSVRSSPHLSDPYNIPPVSGENIFKEQTIDNLNKDSASQNEARSQSEARSSRPRSAVHFFVTEERRPQTSKSEGLAEALSIRSMSNPALNIMEGEESADPIIEVGKENEMVGALNGDQETVKEVIIEENEPNENIVEEVGDENGVEDKIEIKDNDIEIEKEPETVEPEPEVDTGRTDDVASASTSVAGSEIDKPVIAVDIIEKRGNDN